MIQKILTNTVVMSELTQKTKIMFLFLQEQVFFWSTTQLRDINSALQHIRKTARPVCQCLSLFSHS